MMKKTQKLINKKPLNPVKTKEKNRKFANMLFSFKKSV